MPFFSSCCVVLYAPMSVGMLTSGHASPIWVKTWARAEPPRRLLPSAMSTWTSTESSAFRSGVTTCVMSGQVTYAEMTRLPGAMTVSPAAEAAMDKESLPPSTAMPISTMASLSAVAASYMMAPSAAILAAYIQFTDALMSSRHVEAAHTMLVMASPMAMRAIALGLISPLSGCSPMDVAAPVCPEWVWAMTATSATGSCSGPQHCCWATSPVTDLSTLVVKKRLEHTDGSLSTRSRADATVVPAGMSSGATGSSLLLNLYVLFGRSPSTFSRSRSTGFWVPGGASLSTRTTLPLPSIAPSTCMLQRSLAQISSSTCAFSGLMSRQSFS